MYWMGRASEHCHKLCTAESIPVEATQAKNDIAMSC